MNTAQESTAIMLTNIIKQWDTGCMDNPAHPDPSQELPSPPEEKLLRPPTFGEKYGKYRWTILSFIVILVACGIYIAVNNIQAPPQPQTTYTPLPTSPPVPTEDPTANWKTYTSNTGGYSIKYPNTQTIQQNQISSVDGVQVQAKDTIQLLPNGLTIIFKTIDKNQTLSDYLNENSWCVDITPEKGKSYILDEKEGLIFEYTPCGSWGTTEIDILNNETLYIIRSSNYDEETRQILSTFQFSN